MTKQENYLKNKIQCLFIEISFPECATELNEILSMIQNNSDADDGYTDKMLHAQREALNKNHKFSGHTHVLKEIAKIAVYSESITDSISRYGSIDESINILQPMLGLIKALDLTNSS